MIGFMKNVSGCSIPVVRVHGVDVDRVQFPAARQVAKTISAMDGDGFVFGVIEARFCEGRLLSVLENVADFGEEKFLFWGVRGFQGFFGAKAIQLSDKEENGERGDDKADDVGKEEAVVDGWRPGLLCGFERGECFFGEVPVEFGEVDLVENEPQGRHHNVGNEGGDNFPKSGADNNTDREIDNVSFYGKFFEFFDEGCHRWGALFFTLSLW